MGKYTLDDVKLTDEEVQGEINSSVFKKICNLIALGGSVHEILNPEVHPTKYLEFLDYCHADKDSLKLYDEAVKKAATYADQDYIAFWNKVTDKFESLENVDKSINDKLKIHQKNVELKRGEVKSNVVLNVHKVLPDDFFDALILPKHDLYRKSKEYLDRLKRTTGLDANKLNVFVDNYKKFLLEGYKREDGDEV